MTARKEADEELRRTRGYLSALAETAPGVLYSVKMTKDGLGQILYATQNLEALLGFDDTAWHKPGFIPSRLHPEDTEENDEFKRVLQRDGHAVSERRIRHKDGHYVSIRDSATCSPQPDGSFLITGFAQDVTLEKEQAAQLDQAHRMLSLGELASGLGHELGQPLMAISMAAENGRFALQQDPARIEMAQQKFDRILRMAERAGNIITSMRTVGHTESGTTAWLNLADLVDDTIGVMKDRLQREAIHVHVSVPADLPKVRVAPTLFQQVLINLLANACDAYERADAPQGVGKTVRIDGQAGNGGVSLRIEDQAGGVPPEVIDHIFDPFFTTKGPDKGTGLGLSICYGIIRQAGGTLSVHNTDGGAAFEILLPASEAASERMTGAHAA